MKRFLLIGVLFSAAASAQQPLAISDQTPAYIQPQAYVPVQNQTPAYNTEIPGLGASVSTEYFNHESKLSYGEKMQLEGVAFNLSSNPHLSGWYGRFEALKDKDYDLDYYEFTVGAQINMVNYLGLYVLGQIGLGYAWAEAPEMFNTVNFTSLPVGLEIGLSLAPEFSVYTGVGYKWLWDSTSDSVCRDGTPSNSTGNGTCSWHGGVAYYNDYIGDNDGMTYKAGLRYNF